MRRQELTVLSTIVIVSLFLPATVLAVGGDMGVGTEPLTDGSETYPYLIEDLADFDTFAADTAYWASGVHTKLMTDIDLSGRTYTTAVIAPDIDNTNWNFDGISYEGVFDGNTFTIANLQIVQITDDYIGLFGNTSPDGQINNLILTNAYLEGNQYVGGIAGDNSASIHSCSVEVNIQSDYGYAGGIAGYNDGPISFSNSSSVVKGCQYLGGLTGWNENNIDHCSTNGTVQINVSNGWLVGGLAGIHGQIQNASSVTDSFSTVTVIGSNWNEKTGGLIGMNYGVIERCYATGNITNSDAMLGGLIGYNRGSIHDCYATGDVSGNSYDIGGLIGYDQSSSRQVINCYATGNVKGEIDIGGLIGFCHRSNITNCYSTGRVEGIDSTGGLVGYNSSGTIADCFWDIETSGIVDPEEGLPDTDGLMGKTTLEMMAQSTFADAGWDFSTPIWVIEEGVDYPHLWWEIVPGPVDLAVELGETIIGLEFPAGIENGLQVKLDGALKALEDDNENNDGAAINSLQAFINAVNAQRGKAIFEEDADSLIATARQIIDMLSNQ